MTKEIEGGDLDLGNFQCICPACSEVFELDENKVTEIFVYEPDDETGIEIKCPVCGHVQTID